VIGVSVALEATLRRAKGSIRVAQSTTPIAAKIAPPSFPLSDYCQNPSIPCACRAAPHVPDREAIYQCFPGVEGGYYFIAGIGVNHRQSGGICSHPCGWPRPRAEVNGGYLSYAKARNGNPF